MAQSIGRGAKFGQERRRLTVVGPVDDHDELEGAGVGEHRVDQGREQLGALAGGDHDTDPRPDLSRVAFVAWGAVGGRPVEWADALGAGCLCLYPPASTTRPGAVRRYLTGTVATGRFVRKQRPRVVIVTNPPVVAGLVTYGWAKSIGARLVLDSHPGAFGAQGDAVAARLQFVHRWLVRRSEFSLVASPEWADIVAGWGGDAEVVHEAPNRDEPTEPKRAGRLRILFVGRFAPDEPFDLVLRAAAEVPDVDVTITGDLDRCPPELVAGAPPNVDFCGFLDPSEYRRALENTDVVMCLSSEPASVMRAAYEAIYARRPLITSGWASNRELFASAVAVEHRVASLVGALKYADANFEALCGLTESARVAQMARYEAQRHKLVERLRALVS